MPPLAAIGQGKAAAAYLRRKPLRISSPLPPARQGFDEGAVSAEGLLALQWAPPIAARLMEARYVGMIGSKEQVSWDVWRCAGWPFKRVCRCQPASSSAGMQLSRHAAQRPAAQQAAQQALCALCRTWCARIDPKPPAPPYSL